MPSYSAFWASRAALTYDRMVRFTPRVESSRGLKRLMGAFKAEGATLNG